MKKNFLKKVILGSLLSTSALIYFTEDYFINNRDREITVSWNREPKSDELEIISGKEIGPTNINLVAENSLKKGELQNKSVKNKKNREIASTTSYTPEIVKINGQKKLLIRLKFLCSSWNFLFDDYMYSDPSLQNMAICSDYAKYSTTLANTIYENSRIPVYFQQMIVFEPSVYKNLVGNFPNTQEILNRLSDNAPFGQRVNSTRDLKDPYLIPAIRVKSSITSTYQAFGGGNVVNKSVRVNVPRIGQGYIPQTVRCTNPDSTQRITNFELTWGVSRQAFLNAPRKWGEDNATPCGSCPIPNAGAYGIALSATSSPFSDNPKCEYSCICVHASNPQSNSWPILSYPDSKAKANVLLGGGACGSFPGAADDLSPYNDCGYRIDGSTPTLMSTQATIHLSPDKYERIPEADVFRWSDNVPIYPASDIDINDNRIRIILRPFRGPTEAAIAGMSRGIADIRKRIVYDVLGENIVSMPDRTTYLKTYGTAVVNLEVPLALTVAHEVGHILGGWHEQSQIKILADSNPAFSLDELRKRMIGAFISEATPDKPVYGTVMAAALGNRINFFSTTAFRTPDGLIIGINEDNRQSITTMVDYLAGERLDPEPKRSERAAKLATDLILSK